MIAFNGELYNVGELRSELGGRGHRFASTCDTEVVLAAYDEWGVDALLRLRGMFALAIWDPGASRLLLARDRLGIKPLYYRAGADGIAFASEVRTLVGAGLAPAELSQAGLASYLMTGAVEEPLSILEGTLMLPAGHRLLWSAAGIACEPYWSLADSFGAPAAQGSRDELVAELRERLEDAVRSQLIADVPLGVFLSGGIDSSALVGLVAATAGEPPRTVSVVFPARLSEAPHMRTVAEAFGTRHTEISLSDEDFAATLPSALAGDGPADGRWGQHVRGVGDRTRAGPHRRAVGPRVRRAVRRAAGAQGTQNRQGAHIPGDSHW